MIFCYFVDLYELDKNATQKKIATFRMREDEPDNIEIDGDGSHPVLESIKSEGIFDYKNSRPGKLFLYDGINFLENLKYHFRSGYLSATDVKKQIIDN